MYFQVYHINNKRYPYEIQMDRDLRLLYTGYYSARYSWHYKGAKRPLSAAEYWIPPPSGPILRGRLCTDCILLPHERRKGNTLFQNSPNCTIQKQIIFETFREA